MQVFNLFINRTFFINSNFSMNFFTFQSDNRFSPQSTTNILSLIIASLAQKKFNYSRIFLLTSRKQSPQYCSQNITKTFMFIIDDCERFCQFVIGNSTFNELESHKLSLVSSQFQLPAPRRLF